LDIFILEGDAGKIRELADLLLSGGGMDYVKLIVA
jgi:metal-responsive CopG/Arc/MetJ family transcriptional regulator